MGLSFKRRWRFSAWTADGSIGGRRVMLVKPRTFMNRSGTAVRSIIEYYNVEPEGLLVVCDDLDLDDGRLRARRDGSPGGHNGLKSIAESLATDNYQRLKFGIGTARGEDPVRFVLGQFRRGEQSSVDDAIVRAAEAVECWLGAGVEACMNRYN